VDSRLALVHRRLYVGLSCREYIHVEEFRALGISHWADHRRTRCADDLLQSHGELSYLWNPIKDDGNTKPLTWYETTLSFARSALANPESRLVVTCARGQHRGPSMAYLILRAIYGQPEDQALQTLDQAWPTAEPWYRLDIESKLGQL
jgi:hypothetical protein